MRDGQPLRLVSAISAGVTYGFPMENVERVARGADVQGNPAGEAPAGWLLGPTELPVFSLDALLSPGERPASPPRADQVVVVRGSSGESWGILVERVAGRALVPPERLHELPALTRGPRHLFDAVAVLPGDEIALVPSLEALRSDVTPPTVAAAPLPSRFQEPEASEQPGGAGGGGRIVVFSSLERSPTGRRLAFALSVRQVLEVTSALPVVRVAGAHPAALGLCAWRSRPIPVLDIVRSLELRFAAADGLEKLLVVRAAATGEVMAIPIRPDLRLRSLPLPHVPVVPDIHVEAHLVKGVFQSGEETLLVPDLDALPMTLTPAGGVS